MHLDEAGIDLITSHEGLRLKAYWDAHGKLWTIGYGHTATAKQGMKITKAQARELFRKDIERFEECVERTINVELTQGQFNALVSLAYNLGCGGFQRSSLVEKINQGGPIDPKALFGRYTKANGKVLAGLVKRRNAEAKMFAEGRTTNGRASKVYDFAQWVLGGSVSQMFSKQQG